MLVMLLTAVNATPAYAQSKYTGGLLDGAAISLGKSVGTPTSTSAKMTDNNTGTNEPVQNLAWYTFTTPQEISAVVVNSRFRNEIEFYDASNNLLHTYKPIQFDGVESLPSAVKNVSTVVLRTPSGGAYVLEWNVFTTPSAVPNPTTINWIQGGDKIVRLDWDNTGGKSYTVKRSTSSSGLYQPVASNVTGTTYFDQTVSNDVMYYYVVTANNEAGESANSPEKPIKPSATKYTGGLLDNVELPIGKSIDKPTALSKKMTDNNVSTNEPITTGNFTWHTFTSPKVINSLLVHSDHSTKVEFYDANQNLLYTYDVIKNDGVQSLPTPVENVSTVILKDAVGIGMIIKEFNVYETPSAPPVVTKINWVYGGNQIVNLEWDEVGAKSYDVKRATAKEGPYFPLETNIKGTSFSDKSVTNGVTYYYKITSVNEAGKSADSVEAKITPHSSKYTGGLLDGLVIQTGKTIHTTLETTRKMTDNDVKTEQLFVNNGYTVAWYDFKSPKEIKSIILKSKVGVEHKVEFYDANQTLLHTHVTSTNDSLEVLPQPIKNVSLVALRVSKAELVNEWNVFGKSDLPPTQAPMNLKATGSDAQVTLNWSKVADAASYKIKRSTTAGGTYTAIATVDAAQTSYTDKTVTNGTTYYYAVTAVGAAGESANSNEASATPKAVVIDPEPNPEPNPNPGNEDIGDRALLTLTLDNGTEKEYDLSVAEVNAFLTWYDMRAEGKGKTTFAFDKHNNNKGPFKKRKEYIKFDSIYNFEVNGYESGKGSEGPETPPTDPTPLPEEL
ncbi:fibronectin type III domain-containing protein [Paenibacillus agilis]|uniref:Fibronectin type III domain-containing protein n=2 Tax=Paenibacillus agilis TaxID=3020863 RepID=A0A559J3R2_9BACL|nr:fibronectin type III domain-containing protein [Paenibacillus agilis]